MVRVTGSNRQGWATSEQDRHGRRRGSSARRRRAAGGSGEPSRSSSCSQRSVTGSTPSRRRWKASRAQRAEVDLTLAVILPDDAHEAGALAARFGAAASCTIHVAASPRPSTSEFALQRTRSTTPGSAMTISSATADCASCGTYSTGLHGSRRVRRLRLHRRARVVPSARRGPDARRGGYCPGDRISSRTPAR